MEEAVEEIEEKPWWRTLLKYFLHGLAFSVIFLLLVFVWALILVILVMTGALIGLLIGIFVLFFFIGGLNSLLTDLIWSIPIKTRWTSILSHGFVLFIALIIVGIPAIVIGIVAPSIVTSIVLFIIYAFVDGYVAKNIATQWKKEDNENNHEDSPNERLETLT